MQFITSEITKWLSSRERRLMLKGNDFYHYRFEGTDKKVYKHDEDGATIAYAPEDLTVIDNLYANMVDQKVNYILGKPFSIQSQNETYTNTLTYMFDKAFKRMLSRVAIDCINEGIGWVYPYYNDAGELNFRCYPGHEILPFWLDSEHTQLDAAIRYYTTTDYVGTLEQTTEHIEVYAKNGIHRYIFSGGTLQPEGSAPEFSYAVLKGENGEETPLSWGKIPLVPFKCNPHEIPLILRTQTLQEAINRIRSNWANTMNEDIMTTILAVYGYGGEERNVAGLRKNLLKYGAVLLENDGKIEPVRVEREPQSYSNYLEDLGKAFIRNARGFDARDDRMSSNPNQMNLRSMYSDIDLDADMMELQFQAAFDDLLWFVDRHLLAAGRGDFTKEEVVFRFTRNIIVNDSETITNIKNSEGIVSRETLLANHPFVSDWETELKKVQKEEDERLNLADDYPDLTHDHEEAEEE